MKAPQDRAHRLKKPVPAARLSLALSLALLLIAAVTPAAQASENNDQPRGGTETSKKDSVRVSPQKVFEAVSAYMEGMHGAASPGSTRPKRKEQRRQDTGFIPTEDASRSVIDRESALAQLRMERGEWDLAASPLERALTLAQASASPDRSNRIELDLRDAQDRVSRDTRKDSWTPGEVVNSIGLRLIVVPPGTFTMGSSSAEARRVRNDWSADENIMRAEQPDHKVRISEPFALGKYHVTVGQFALFARDTGYRTVAEKQGWGWVYDENAKHWTKKNGASWRNPGMEVYEDYPVTMVCHQDAQAFCDWLSGKENRRYYLPTEAQWEFAARGGKEGQRFPWGDEYPDGKKLNMADRRSPVPWADKTVDDGYSRMSPVGCYQPNSLWLYDIVGNLWHMCSDYFERDAYEKNKTGVTTDPTGPRTGKKMVVRGGNWAFGAGLARNSFRFGIDQDMCADIVGFRIATAVSDLDVPADKSRNATALTRESVSRMLDSVKGLVGSGKRLEAMKRIERVGDPEPKGKILLDHPGVFVRDVLDALVDVSADKTMENFNNSLGMKMVRIPAGAFLMGSSETDIAWAMGTLAQGQAVSLENEFPFHKVRLTRPFFIGATEVTVGQFRRFVEETGYITDAEAEKGGQIFDEREGRFEKKDGSSWKNPGWKIEDNQPVVMVSWDDAQAFVEWLSAREKMPYKLPTEAQWEYSARGGLPMSHFPWGDSLPDGKRANYADNLSGFEWRDREADDGYKFVAPVGSYEPNGYGLYDMAGNVLEWVRDFYGEDYYRYAPEVDPEGPGHGETRVTKGGEWTFGAVNMRCAFRGWARPETATYNTGFRVAIELGAPQRAFHLADDFLTKQWVPDTDQRAVAMAVAQEADRQKKAGRTETAKVPEKAPAVVMMKGVLILGFTPKSDARKVNMSKGDVIIEYNGERDLTAEKFLALTNVTKKDRSRPVVVFVRDGYEHSVRVAPGFLGINVMDTMIKEPTKRREPEPDRPQDDKKAHPKEWT